MKTALELSDDVTNEGYHDNDDGNVTTAGVRMSGQKES